MIKPGNASSGSRRPKITTFIIFNILIATSGTRSDDNSQQRVARIATKVKHEECKLFPWTSWIPDYLHFIFEVLEYFANVVLQIGRTLYFVLDTTIITFCEVIANVFSGARQLANFFEFLGHCLQALLDVNYNLVSSIFAWFQRLVQTIIDFVKYILESLWGLISSVFKTILRLLHNVVRSISSLFDVASHGVTTTSDTAGVALHKSYDSVTYMVSLPGSALMTVITTTRAIMELFLMTVVNTVVFVVELVINFLLLINGYVSWTLATVWTFITLTCDKIVILGKILENGLTYLIVSLYSSIISACNYGIHAFLLVTDTIIKAVLSIFYYIGRAFVVSLLAIVDTAMKGFSYFYETLREILSSIQSLFATTTSYIPGGILTVISVSSSSFIAFSMWFVFNINILTLSFEKLEVIIQLIVSLLTREQSNTEDNNETDVEEHPETQFREERPGPSNSSKLPYEPKPYSTKELERKLAQEKEKNLCVVCQDESKSVLIMPCKHLCVCRRCADILMKQTSWRCRICPLCRGRIISTMDIYA